jgi:hypothetical protein
MLLEQKKINPDVVVTSDALGNWGCGAYCTTTWFQLQWEESTKLEHTTIKELIPMLLAAGVVGKKLDWEIGAVLK